MKRKSLTVKNKVHKKILSHLNNKEFKKIYKNFEEFLNIEKLILLLFLYQVVQIALH